MEYWNRWHVFFCYYVLILIIFTAAARLFSTALAEYVSRLAGKCHEDYKRVTNISMLLVVWESTQLVSRNKSGWIKVFQEIIWNTLSFYNWKEFPIVTKKVGIFNGTPCPTTFAESSYVRKRCCLSYFGGCCTFTAILFHLDEYKSTARMRSETRKIEEVSRLSSCTDISVIILLWLHND